MQRSDTRRVSGQRGEIPDDNLDAPGNAGVLLAPHADRERLRFAWRNDGPTGAGPPLRMVRLRQEPTSAVQYLENCIVPLLAGLDEPVVSRHSGNGCLGGVGSSRHESLAGIRLAACQDLGAGHGGGGPDGRGRGQDGQQSESAAQGCMDGRRSLGVLWCAVYTHSMEARKADKDGSYRVDPTTEPPVIDPIAQLATVYRDYPGLRALIMRRVRDPQIAADILQDADATTIEK